MENTPLAAMDAAEREQLQRRTLRTLMGGLIPAGAGMSGAYSAAAILGEELSGSAPAPLHRRELVVQVHEGEPQLSGEATPHRGLPSAAQTDEHDGPAQLA